MSHSRGKPKPILRQNWPESVQKTFGVRHILILTLCVALSLPFLLAFFRPLRRPETFVVSDLAVQQTLSGADPDVLVLRGGWSSGSQSSHETETELFIATSLKDSSEIFRIVLSHLEQKIATEKWRVSQSEGTADSRWFRLKKNETVCVLQVWVAEPTPEQQARLSHLKTNRYVIKISTTCFHPVD